MYRSRVHFFPKTFEAFAALVQIGEEWRKVAADRGWVEPRYWISTVGGMEVIAEYDFPDLATYQRQLEEQFADADSMAFMQRIMALEYNRPSYDELLNTPPALAA
jgi:hypothetical protein